jgi:hypothetical protein
MKKTMKKTVKKAVKKGVKTEKPADVASPLHHYVKDGHGSSKKVEGPAPRLRNASKLRGNCTGLYGNASNLYGDCSYVYGCCTKVSGCCTPCHGLLTGKEGDVQEVTREATELADRILNPPKPPKTVVGYQARLTGLKLPGHSMTADTSIGSTVRVIYFPTGANTKTGSAFNIILTGKPDKDNVRTELKFGMSKESARILASNILTLISEFSV